MQVQSSDLQSMIAHQSQDKDCLLYTSDAADEEDSVDLGGRRILKKKKRKKKQNKEKKKNKNKTEPTSWERMTYYKQNTQTEGGRQQ